MPAFRNKEVGQCSNMHGCKMENICWVQLGRTDRIEAYLGGLTQLPHQREFRSTFGYVASRYATTRSTFPRNFAGNPEIQCTGAVSRKYTLMQRYGRDLSLQFSFFRIAALAGPEVQVPGFGRGSLGHKVLPNHMVQGSATVFFERVPTIGTACILKAKWPISWHCPQDSRLDLLISERHLSHLTQPFHPAAVRRSW